MARPKPASRIPDWFNLDAYDRLSGLDANGWLTVAVLRTVGIVPTKV